MEEQAAKQVKCLIWDLDRTLWEGVLSEGGSTALREGVRETLAELDGENCRSGVLPLPDESEQEYIAALEQDYAALSAVIDPVMPDDAVRAFTYPYGKYNEISEVVLDTMGVTVTVTTEPGMAEVVRGLPQSMRVLNRFAMTEEVTPQELLGLVQSNRNN